MVYLNPVNELMMKIASTKPVPQSQPFKSLRGKQIFISSLNGDHRKVHNQGKVSGSMNTDTVNVKYKSEQSSKESLFKTFEGNFVLSKTIKLPKQ